MLQAIKTTHRIIKIFKKSTFANDDDGRLDGHDPEIEQDLLYKSSDDQTFTVADDVHLDAPQLLDLLSDKPVAGGLKAPLEKEATVPLPSIEPVQWEFNLL